MAPVMLGDEEALVRVLSGRASRSVVKPGEPAAVYVKIKGKAWAEFRNDHVLLRVMNTAGALQHAASFGEFMQQVLIEGAALDAAFSAEYGDDWDVDDDSFSLEEALRDLLDALEVPWPIARFFGLGEARVSLFRGAIKEHRSRERGLQTLRAFASTSAIGGVPFELFAQWLVYAPVLLADVPKLVHSAAAEYIHPFRGHLWECGVAPNCESGWLSDKHDEVSWSISWSTTAAAVPDDDEPNADY
ncbi:hypothetical protein M885DRAFT_600504 [Pelagophyceae sp. CCMP2097]|nr:hypothetical protein M885DRAFT_600504 [Pelagophyceae sp. CCMP2097]